MYRLPFKYLCIPILLIILSVVASNAHAVQAEIAWIESEQQVNSIRFARFDGDEWMQMDEPLYVSENPLTSLALGTDNLGKKTLIWTEQRRVKTVLVSMTAYTDASNTLKWSTPGLFSDYGRENFSASILYDRNGTGWVFWAATTKNYSDIVVQRYVNGSWSEPEQVNQANEVPDNIPKASINEDGDVRVEWNSYDFDSGGYLSRTRDFPVSVDATAGVLTKLADKTSEKDVRLPPNISTEFAAVLHFPGNQVIQSVSLNGVN